MPLELEGIGRVCCAVVSEQVQPSDEGLKFCWSQRSDADPQQLKSCPSAAPRALQDRPMGDGRFPPVVHI